MRRIAIAQLGTVDTLNELEFMAKVSEMTIRKTVPAAIRLIAEKAPEPHKTTMLKAAKKCEENGTKTAAREAKIAVADYRVDVVAVVCDAVADYWADVVVAVRGAAGAAYRADVVDAAGYAADAAGYAADAAGYAASAAAYASAAYASAAYYVAKDACAAARDKVLSDYAEDIVQILIEMETPGSKFLFLTE